MSKTTYLTTHELAELLRIKERKVYDLAAAGEVPCSRATGKLLFPRREIEAWLASRSSGPRTIERSSVFLGSHDPLLDWAMRESRCGIASYFDGSLDGLNRFAGGEGIATSLHLHDSQSDAWNTPVIAARFFSDPVVLIEWAWRERGLITALNGEKRISGIADLKGMRVAPRQAEAGSQALFTELMQAAGLSNADISATAPARSEADAALAVLEGKADAVFGLKALALQHRLGFVPVVRERFDLLVWRKAWFDPPFQTFLAFCRSEAFAARAKDLGGYDVSGLGRVHFNGP